MSHEETKEAAAHAATAAVEAYGPPNRVVLRIVFILLFVAGVVWIIYKVTGILLLLVLSIFFAYLVAPLVEFLRRPRTLGSRTLAMPKSLAILLAYLTILDVTNETLAKWGELDGVLSHIGMHVNPEIADAFGWKILLPGAVVTAIGYVLSRSTKR